MKQVPIDSLQRDKTFCFFSHTIKVCCNQVFRSDEPQLTPRDNLRIQTTEARAIFISIILLQVLSYHLLDVTS